MRYLLIYIISTSKGLKHILIIHIIMSDSNSIMDIETFNRLTAENKIKVIDAMKSLLDFNIEMTKFLDEHINDNNRKVELLTARKQALEELYNLQQ